MLITNKISIIDEKQSGNMKNKVVEAPKNVKTQPPTIPKMLELRAILGCKIVKIQNIFEKEISRIF
jgi:hypothetical protein